MVLSTWTWVTHNTDNLQWHSGLDQNTVILEGHELNWIYGLIRTQEEKIMLTDS